jgi:hypothetical protein
MTSALSSGFVHCNSDDIRAAIQAISNYKISDASLEMYVIATGQDLNSIKQIRSVKGLAEINLMQSKSPLGRFIGKYLASNILLIRVDDEGALTVLYDGFLGDMLTQLYVMPTREALAFLKWAGTEANGAKVWYSSDKAFLSFEFELGIDGDEECVYSVVCGDDAANWLRPVVQHT